ncbi:MAG: SDR family oxidoreductase [Halioglobus sp.]
MLEGQVAVVTGGGRGIGRSIAKELALRGAAVALMGRSLSHLQATAEEIEAAGGRALAIPCDVTAATEVTAALAQSDKELGPLTLLVNNAGVADGGRLWEMPAEDWWRVIEVNLKGPFLVSHAALPGLVARGTGRIINIGSYAANSAGMGGSAYSTSKAALQRLTEGIAADLEGTGVTALAFSPGFVWTDMGNDYDRFLRANVPTYEGMADDWVFPPQVAANFCARLAAGDADALSGRLLHVRDDLDKMIAKAQQIADDELYTLRLTQPEDSA